MNTTTNAVALPPPFGIHPMTIADPNNVIRSADERFLIAYCPRFRTGAFFDFDHGLWSLHTPIGPREFLASIAQHGIVVREGAALQAWLDRVMLVPADGSTARH